MQPHRKQRIIIPRSMAIVCWLAALGARCIFEDNSHGLQVRCVGGGCIVVTQRRCAEMVELGEPLVRGQGKQPTDSCLDTSNPEKDERI